MSERYTVLVGNELLGRSHFTGTFDSYGAAEEYVRAQTDRTRTFATYQIHQGTPKAPGKEVGPMFRGTK